jgi:ethanolamine ammonia-lyase small subunit
MQYVLITSRDTNCRYVRKTIMLVRQARFKDKDGVGEVLVIRVAVLLCCATIIPSSMVSIRFLW